MDTCLVTVVGGRQGHVPCKIASFQHFPFVVSVELYGDLKTITQLT